MGRDAALDSMPPPQREVMLLRYRDDLSYEIAEMAKAAMLGVLPWMSVIGIAMPFIIVLGLLSTLIATLATVGMFLRLRTTSLSEIQLRLAALEDMIASRGDASKE